MTTLKELFFGKKFKDRKEMLDFCNDKGTT